MQRDNVKYFSLRFFRVNITPPSRLNFQRYIIYFRMLFTFALLITELAMLSSNVIFLICLLCVNLANATVLITTATMLTATSTALLNSREISRKLKECFILLLQSEKIVQLILNKTYITITLRCYTYSILSCHV